MSESAHIQSFQVEELLHSYGEALAEKRGQDMPVRRAGFDVRSLVAGFLAVFVFAPGCAAATVFLMKADDRLLVAATDNLPRTITKSNRLPLSEWRAKAPAGKADVAPYVAPTTADASFLEPVAIRGRLDDKILAAVTSDAAAPTDTAIIPPRPKRKHEVRRARPASVVAEAVISAPAPPSLLEKLFALRIL